VRNAIDPDMVAALQGAYAPAQENPVIVLPVGEGSTFAAGADIVGCATE
jgi:enoyl-CoA hydratase